MKALLGQKIVVKHKKQQMEWTVVEHWEPISSELQDLKPLGLVDFPAMQYSQSEILANLFLHLAFVDWHLTLQKMNAAINDNNMKKKVWVKQFREEEFLVTLGLLIGYVECGTRGEELWVTSSHKDGKDELKKIEGRETFLLR